VRRKPGSAQLETRRVVYFHRDNLLPSQQDIYDREGNLVTQVTYGPYKDFDSIQYPSSITIMRPLDKVQIVLTIDSVKQNAPMTADQFEITNIPKGTPVKDMQ
jgi:hypothetical protein